MIQAPFSIIIDTDGDYHFALPHTVSPKLPEGKQVASLAPSVECAVRDIIDAGRAFQEGDRDTCNSILSQYYRI